MILYLSTGRKDGPVATFQDNRRPPEADTDGKTCAKNT